MLLIDSAWQHEDPRATVAAGYGGVLRYLSRDPSKNLGGVDLAGTVHTSEVADLRGAGLDIGLVFEAGDVGMRGGRAQGQSDGTLAALQATALGYPAGCAIYAACDFDAQPGDYPTLVAYLDGFGSALGHHAVGIYGGLAVVDTMLAGGHAVYGWQTVAWSGGRVSDHAHLYQRIATTTSLQGSYDEDVTLRPGGDIGAWSHTPPAPTPGPAPQPPNLGAQPWLGRPVPSWWRGHNMDIGYPAGGDLQLVRRWAGCGNATGPMTAGDRQHVRVAALRAGVSDQMATGVVTLLVARTIGASA